jgi:quinolinate synthase
MGITENINKLKKKKNAIILAHYYQNPEIQDIADYIGDSLGLSQMAAKTKANIIVFCGVLFMAETAKILNNKKKVLLPDLNAGCSLADSCSYRELNKLKKIKKNHKIISYINCSAKVKTISDVICTSSNAIKIVESFNKNQKLIFVPDKNLGGYINSKTGRDMLLWEGSCQVHDMLTIENVIKLKKKHPKAKIIAHPECKGQILSIADFIGSTTALLNFTLNDESREYIVATETGIIHQMKKNNKDKNFYIVSNNEACSCNDCPYMKITTLEKVYNCLKTEKPEILLSEKTIELAKKPLLKMLRISKNIN